MCKEIQDISEIRFGYYAQPDESGTVPYLQVRQFTEQGILAQKPDEFIKLDKKSESHLLQDGDVLLVGKGNRLFAWCYRESFGPYIASSIFFVLRPNREIIYPEYLTTVLNIPASKTVFQQLGGGSNIFSIRKSELGAFEILLPSMDKQMEIAAYAALFQKDLALSSEIISQKQYLYQGIIAKLLK
ncbi:MAG TPA: restriction endonuclease subunit S [Saprospiraceae bacterium]|nr:restriction endonuclease subunit S [Saprospiraceae bacterium]